MFAKINISLFVFTIILMSITWQNVPHHIHSEAALLIGEGYRVTHMIVFFIDPTPNHFRKAHYNYMLIAIHLSIKITPLEIQRCYFSW